MVCLLLTTILIYVTVLQTVKMPPLTYGREELLKLRPETRTRVPSSVYDTLKHIGICSVKSTKRGHRSLNKSQHQIPCSRISEPFAQPGKLSVCCWNIQSLGNKTLLLTDYILEHDMDDEMT